MKYTLKPNGEANTRERHNYLMMRCFTLSLYDDTLLLYDDTLTYTYIQIIIPIFE